MKQSSVDWEYLFRNLRTPIITAVVVAVVCAASVWFSSIERERYESRSVDKDLMNEDYNALVVRKRLVDRYHRRYEMFQKQGFVAVESRLDWVETLREISESLALPSLTYSISAQDAIVPPVPQTSGDAATKIYRSRLELDVGLVHEGDFLRLFDTLQSRTPGLLRVQNCALTRRAGSDELSTIDANIAANCVVDMFSVVTADVGGTEAGL